MSTLPMTPIAGRTLPAAQTGLGNMLMTIAAAPFRVVGGLLSPVTGALTKAPVPPALTIGKPSAPIGAATIVRSSPLNRASVQGGALDPVARLAQGPVNLLNRIGQIPPKLVSGSVKAGASAINRIKTAMTKSAVQKDLASTAVRLKNVIVASGEGALKAAGDALISRIKTWGESSQPVYPDTGYVGVSVQDPQIVYRTLPARSTSIFAVDAPEPPPVIQERRFNLFGFLPRSQPPDGIPLPGESVRESITRIERTSEGIPLWVWIVLAVILIVAVNRKGR